MAKVEAVRLTPRLQVIADQIAPGARLHPTSARVRWRARRKTLRGMAVWGAFPCGSAPDWIRYARRNVIRFPLQVWAEKPLRIFSPLRRGRQNENICCFCSR